MSARVAAGGVARADWVASALVPEPVGLLESFLPRDRCLALATGGTVPVRSSGAALFADISGFTVLSERMAVQFGPRRGAEELTVVLNASNTLAYTP